MKHLLSIALAFSILVGAGCASFHQRSYATIGTAVHLVDGSRKAWNDYVYAGLATTNQVREVHKAYTDFQRVVIEAESTVRAYKDGQDKGAVQAVLQATTQASVSVVNLITHFRGGTNSALPLLESPLNSK
jgi:hypothetical protein